MSYLTGFLPVLRTTINNTYSLSAARYRYLTRRERVWEPLVVGLSLGLTALAFVFMLYQVTLDMARAGVVLGQPGVVLTFAFLGVSVLVFVFGLFMVVSVFYFSNDLPLLVPLPVSPGAIVMAKFTAALIGQYAGVVAVLAPAALAYAKVMDAGYLYWLFVLVIAGLTPVAPLALASIIALVFMRFINRRHRDLLLVVLSLIIVAAVMVFQLSLVSVPDDQLGDHMRQIMAGRIELVERLGRGFPPVVWATRAAEAPGTVQGVVSLAGVAALAAIGVGMIGLVGERYFYRGLIGGQEVSRRRARAGRSGVGVSETLAGLRSRTVLLALYQREWRLFMRQPLYVMNGFLASIIVPVIAFFGLSVPGEQLDALIGEIPAGGPVTFVVAMAAAGVIAFLASMNTTAVTSVSREGKRLWISKMLPASPELMVRAKLLFSAVSALISATPVIAALWVFWKPPGAYLFGASVLGLLASAILLLAGLLIDMTRPYLTWTNPQQAVKTNLNVLLLMPVGALLLVPVGYLAAWLFGRMGHEGLPVMGVVAVVLALLALAAYRLTVGAAGRLYERMDT